MPYSKHGSERVENIYPEREGYTRLLKKNEQSVHIGYQTAEAKLCRCGCAPVFEQYVMDADRTLKEFSTADGKTVRSAVGKKNVPARLFIAACPRCGIRAKGHGTIEECLERWNNEDFTDDSVMISQPIENLSNTGCKRLSWMIMADCIEEAVGLIERKHTLQRTLESKLTPDARREILYPEYKMILAALRGLDDFIRSTPLLWDKDPEGVLSDIRKQLYPGSTKEDIDRRAKIPLRLVSM